MGDTRPTTRTLPSGEKITHYPDGREVLQPSNTLAGLLDANTEQQEADSAALTGQLIDAATSKREALDSGNTVPAEKRPV